MGGGTGRITDIYECDPQTIYFSQKPSEDLGGMILAGSRMS